MKFEIDKKKYIDSGLVAEKEHPTFPLLIYNYTQECQFSKAWDEVTMMCRGLIVHKDTRDIVARPFKKFFNWEEHIAKGDTMPDEIPEVSQKLDGSLGIMYVYDNVPYIATRGSFTSDQALWATQFIRDRGLHVKDGNTTYLFEIIYPENRIVVSYGDFRGLKLLAVVEKETGRTKPFTDFEKHMFPVVEQYAFTSYDELKSLNTKNEEGFVLHYPKADMRVKIKFEDYVKLHKVMTGLSQIGIWEMLRDGKDPFAIELPDEMFGWVEEVSEKLTEKFKDIHFAASNVASAARELPTRKDQAEFISKTGYPGLSFTILDGKDPSPAIWRMVRPRGTVTFRKDIDA